MKTLFFRLGTQKLLIKQKKNKINLGDRGSAIEFIFYVSFPRKYPQTKLVTRLKKNNPLRYAGIETPLAFVELIINESNNNVHIGNFMVYPNSQLHNNILTQDERKCCKGLGKTLLAYSLRKLLHNNLIKKAKLVIVFPKMKLKLG